MYATYKLLTFTKKQKKTSNKKRKREYLTCFHNFTYKK